MIETMNRQTELDSLQQSLNDAINTFRIEMVYANLPPLSTLSTVSHPLDDPNFRTSRRLYESRRLALACITQMKLLLQPPYEKTVEQSLAAYDTACLDVFIQAGVLEALVEPENIAYGLHVKQLQAETGVSAKRLVTILRYLAADGWVRETDEEVFAVNRPALELLPGKKGWKWSLTPGKPKIASALLEWCTHPQWVLSESPVETAFQIAYDTNLNMFATYKDEPETLMRFANAIQSVGDSCIGAIIHDFPWSTLDTPYIIDCGGGQGNLTIALAEAFPTYNFILQDLPEILPLTRSNISKRLPDALSTNRIHLEEHDFFSEQPRNGDEYSFVFRFVLHDWPDHSVVEILKNIANAMGSKSKVIFIEFITFPGKISTGLEDFGDHSSVDSTDIAPTIGVDPRKPELLHAIETPSYIPSNFCVNTRAMLGLGVHLLAALNARQRTLTEWDTATKAAGLIITQVYPLGGLVSIVECIRRDITKTHIQNDVNTAEDGVTADEGSLDI